MIIATLADLSESGDEVLHNAFKLLQRQMKVGLTAAPSLGMYEVGFSDRVIAADLGAQFQNVTDYGSARAAVRRNGELIRAAIAPFPTYFQTVLNELLQ
jgi:hypothetical protein